jgi:hypothetical protein
MGINLSQPMYCCVCEKPTRTPYGRWVVGITCSKLCNDKRVESLRKVINEERKVSSRS